MTGMRARWHKWWLVALAGTACTLNPQPDLPGADRGTSGGGDDGVGINTPPGGGATTSTADGGALTVPVTGTSGEGGEAGARGEAGASGEAGATSDPPVVAR